MNEFVLIPTRSGEAIPIPKEGILVGRGPQATLQIADETVSRLHAEIFLEDGQVVVKDLDSLNGTTVNGMKISRAVVAIGDRIGIFRHEFTLSEAAETGEDAGVLSSLSADTGLG